MGGITAGMQRVRLLTGVYGLVQSKTYGHGYFTSGFRPATRKKREAQPKLRSDESVDDKNLREH